MSNALSVVLQKFSPCSRRSMGAVLASKSHICFKGTYGGFQSLQLFSTRLILMLT